MADTNLDTCPECGFTVLDGQTYCPHCGAQIGQPAWKKFGAWIFLLAIIYFFIKCNIRIMEGLDQF